MTRQHCIKAIGLILLLVIIASVDMGQVMHHLRTCDYRYLIPVILMIIPQVGLRAWRWQRLMAQQGIQCSLRYAFMFYFAAIYIGLMTPGRMGELAKCYFLKQSAIAGISQSLPSVLVDRILDLYFLGVLAIVALYYFGFLVVPQWVAIMVVTTAGVSPWFLIRWARGQDRLVARIGKRVACIAPRWEKSWYAFVEGSRSLMSIRFLEALLLTAASYLLFFGQTCLIGRAMGLPLDGLAITMTVAVGLLVGYIPITVAGLGTREAVFIFLFGRFGISVASALSFAFLYNLVYIACVGMISAFFWMIVPTRSEMEAVRKHTD